MTRDQLIVAVAARMDEITPSSSLSVTVDGADNNPLHALIMSVIDDGVLEIYSIAPYWRLPNTSVTYSASSANQPVKLDSVFTGTEQERKVLKIKLPADFLRMAVFTYPGFARPITILYQEDSPEAKRQHNRFLIAKTEKPVAVIGYGMWYDGPSKEISCYSLPGSATLQADGRFSYIKMPETAITTSSTNVPVPSQLLPALEWTIAARVFGARGDVNHANICQQNAQNLLM